MESRIRRKKNPAGPGFRIDIIVLTPRSRPPVAGKAWRGTLPLQRLESPAVTRILPRGETLGFPSAEGGLFPNGSLAGAYGGSPHYATRSRFAPPKEGAKRGGVSMGLIDLARGPHKGFGAGGALRWTLMRRKEPDRGPAFKDGALREEA